MPSSGLCTFVNLHMDAARFFHEVLDKSKYLQYLPTVNLLGYQIWICILVYQFSFQFLVFRILFCFAFVYILILLLKFHLLDKAGEFSPPLKSTWGSCRGLETNSQHSCVSSQPSGTQVPECLRPLSCPISMWYIHIHEIKHVWHSTKITCLKRIKMAFSY